MNENEVLNFFPIIFNTMFDHMVEQPSRDNQQLAFRTLVRLVDVYV